MTEERKNWNLLNGKSKKGNKDADEKKILPWLVYISLTAVVILAVGAFLQIQIVCLHQELAALRVNFSRWDEERVKNLQKRSSDEIREEEEEEEKQRGGIQAAHLQGSIPFQHIETEGKIGPWSASSTDTTFISLRNRNTEIEITKTGTYHVYAQVYYLTSEIHNSFQILSYNGTEEQRHHRNLATCSSQGRNAMGEISCYTGFTVSLHTGQRLYLNQIEQNRIVHFSNGCTYFGLLLLRKNVLLKQKT